MTTSRFKQALAVYLALGLAGFTVDDIRLQQVLWVFLAGLGLRSYVAWLREKQIKEDSSPCGK
ncbi:MAG: hypothetical protein FJW39_15165 [Acidobacteria bacterium]|nr:hypothetical protein [Acidobacteriota bacterium]